MGQTATWEWALLGVGLLLLMFLWVPGVRAAVARSRGAPRDWMGVIVPISAVILFVILLVISVT